MIYDFNEKETKVIEDSKILIQKILDRNVKTLGQEEMGRWGGYAFRSKFLGTHWTFDIISALYFLCLMNDISDERFEDILEYSLNDVTFTLKKKE